MPGRTLREVVADYGLTLPLGGRDQSSIERLGRYPVTGTLGEGGMGQVLLVADEDIGRELAAKVLLDSGADGPDPALAARFIQEARVLGQLEHPNIVPLHELGATGDGRLYFTMRRIVGDDLAGLIEAQRGGAAPPRGSLELLSIFLKVCDCVAFAHSRGVIHRDLKPANVMVGRFGEVLVCDWGLAATMTNDERRMTNRGASSAGPRQTQVGTVLGTPAYMPPEQARGEVERTDQRSDIYSLGALLYELLTLEPPFDGEENTTVLDQVLHERLVPPRERAPGRDIPWELEAVVLRAMAHDPEQRYAGVPELKGDVEAYLEGGLLRAARYTRRERLRRWIWRRRRALAAGLLLAAALAGAIGTLWQRGRAERAASLQRRAEHRAERERRQRLLDRRIAPLETTMAQARDWLYIPRIDIGPRITRVREALADLQRLAGDAELAARPELWLALGRGALFLDELPRAEQALLEAVRRGLPAAQAALPLGRICLRHALRASLEHDEEAAARRLRSARSWLAHAGGAAGRELVAVYTLVAAGKQREAIAAALAALARGPHAPGSERLHLAIAMSALVHRKSPSNEQVIAACRAALRRRPHRLAWAHELTGHAQYHQGRLDRAIAHLDEAIRIDPRLPAAYKDRGTVRHARGDHDGAIADSTRAIQLEPRYAAAYVSRGMARQAKGDIQGALADLARAIECNPRYAAAFNNRGVVRQGTGDLDGAIADYTRAIQLQPRYAAAYDNRGVARQAKGDLRGSIADHTRAIQLQPRSATTLVNRANARRDGGDPAGAIADYTAAISIDPRQATAFGGRGVARQARGDLDGALRDLDRAIALDPRDARIYTNRGNARQAKGDLDGALADHSRAIALDPRFTGAYSNRANARQAKGDTDGALADLQRALQLDPRFWRGWANRGLLLARRGQRDEARESVRRALRLAPAGEQPGLRALLARLGG